MLVILFTIIEFRMLIFLNELLLFAPWRCLHKDKNVVTSRCNLSHIAVEPIYITNLDIWIIAYIEQWEYALEKTMSMYGCTVGLHWNFFDRYIQYILLHAALWPMKGNLMWAVLLGRCCHWWLTAVDALLRHSKLGGKSIRHSGPMIASINGMHGDWPWSVYLNML